jgi:hypothetical protein
MNNTTIAAVTTRIFLMIVAIAGRAKAHLKFEKAGVAAADLQRDQNESLVTAVYRHHESAMYDPTEGSGRGASPAAWTRIAIEASEIGPATRGQGVPTHHASWISRDEITTALR